jgi:predicted RNA-binding protein with PUA-like domain
MGSAHPHSPGSVRLECPILFSVFRQVRRLERCITLEELKAHKDGVLEGMVLLGKGRLSVQPVTPRQWEFIMGLEEEAGSQ